MEPANASACRNTPTLTRRSYLSVTACLSAVMLMGRGRASGETEEQNVETAGSKAMFQNPLFAGDHPDPTILRVGVDFYMTHTSYSFSPGLVVWHSRDMVNWTPISHVMDAAPTRNEIWAPDMVEHGGHYYIYFPAGGIFVVHADHPRGPWSEPIDLKVRDIDPGHVVGPDGTRYLYSAGGHVIQLAPDGLSTVGKSRKAYDGWRFPSEWKTQGTWLESPKLTRRGEYYYLRLSAKPADSCVSRFIRTHGAPAV